MQGDDNPGPRLLAPQNAHSSWPLQVSIYAPPSEREASLGLLFVMAPAHPLEQALDLAVQAVGQFYRRHLNVACVLLAASIEAALRKRIAVEYDARKVAFEDRQGLNGLVERARLLLDPAPGPKILDEIGKLASHARNPAAPGHAVAIAEAEVAGWMVTAAVVYEWTRLADSAGTEARSSPTEQPPSSG